MRAVPNQNGADVYRQIVESSDDAIITIDLKGVIQTWNKGAQRVFGYRASEIAGKHIITLIPPERHDEEGRILKRIRRGERVDHYETLRIRKGGALIPVSLSVSPILNERRQIIGASKILRDITDRKKVEISLKDNERRMRAIVDTAVDAIITIDHRGTIESANAATERLFGYSESELRGQNVRMLMPEPYRGEHDSYIRNYLRTGKAKIIGIGREVIGLRKDGSSFPLNLSVSEVHLDGRRLFTGIIHDLSERRRLEKQILEASSNEQRRIGQDLHDGLCQELVGIGFAAELLARQLETKSVPESTSARNLGDAMRQAAVQARRLAHGLNPVDVHAGGLPMALTNLAKKISESFGVRCVFQWDEQADVREDSAATHLFRIAQEAVGNAIRHGKAKKISIRLTTSQGKITLSVRDNGAGLPKPMLERISPGALPTSTPLSGMGLQTMHYRARMIGGTFAIQTLRAGGTVVTCSIRQA